MYECVKHGKVTCKQCAGGTEGWQEVTGGVPPLAYTENADEFRLSQIKRRYEEATPGDWQRAETPHANWIVTKDRRLICDVHPEGRRLPPLVGKGNNADFIAHARQDVPWLIEQLAQAMERVQRADDCCHQVLELQAKIQKLERTTHDDAIRDYQQQLCADSIQLVSFPTITPPPICIRDDCDLRAMVGGS